MSTVSLGPDNTPAMAKICKFSRGVMVLSGILGGVSLILFGIFLYTGLPSQINLGLDEAAKLGLNTLLCVLFFLQHSLMQRNWFRKRLGRYLPRIYHGAVFSVFSGIFLIILVLFWQKSTSFTLDLDGPAFWLMRTLFFFAIIGSFITARSLRTFDPFGIREIATKLAGKPAKASVFVVRGAYQWVRHPLYFFSLIMIWAQVAVTMDSILFIGLWTSWIVLGAFLEERDLTAVFGDLYLNYQRNVPMLVPYKWPGISIINNPTTKGDNL